MGQTTILSDQKSVVISRSFKNQSSRQGQGEETKRKTHNNYS